MLKSIWNSMTLSDFTARTGSEPLRGVASKTGSWGAAGSMAPTAPTLASNQEKDTAMAELTEVRGPRMPQKSDGTLCRLGLKHLETVWTWWKHVWLISFFGAVANGHLDVFICRVSMCRSVLFWYISSVRSLCETNCRSHPLRKLWWHTTVPSSGRVLYINLKEHSLT